MKRDLSAENQVKDFYDSAGWSVDNGGDSKDAELWEDLRPAAKNYVSSCRLRICQKLPASGEKILDAASGPVQYPEYLEFSKGFAKRVCVDLSEKALEQARKKLGERGDYFCGSILDLPFADNSMDAAMSLHTIYHIDRDQQAAAVRQLLRVTKPGRPLVIIYANPDRLASRVRRWVLGRATPAAASGVIYYFAHPLSWWKQFQAEAEVRLLPWRSLTAQDSRRFIPDNAFGRFLFSVIFSLENLFPSLAVKLGAYPMIVLTKRA